MTDRDDGSGVDSSRALETLETLEALEDEVATMKQVVREGDDPHRTRFEAVANRLQEVLAETNGGHGTIDTRSGERITPLDPDPKRIALTDVAHALSNLSRFTGQGKEFYSVARHAVHVSREVEARGGTREAQRWGLLHDASEAYFSDVPAPVKQSLPGYTRAEKRFQAAVREAFDLELTVEDERLVDAVDGDIARYELSIHFPANHESPGLECEHDDLESGGDEGLYLRRASELALR
ncbi:hypothetical protein [Natronobacterium texcoconense]|uniref:HD domain-containing protein n=1 Tax=Natronobacterium texcoconense TaxID=1095778 RepID=A0A1H1J1X7_NATTX|nr:hypothetical protein [Natronobacterium texcoconense]SDR43997.1 hypothetical protein SAMN04489842_4036 [Natronobacterium texcoconense]